LDWDDLSLNGEFCQALVKTIVNDWVAWNVWNCWTEVFFVCQEGFCFVDLVIILSKLTDCFTCLTCIRGDQQKAYILNGASLNRFPPNFELIPLSVACAICWTFRETIWILVTISVKLVTLTFVCMRRFYMCQFWQGWI
jgi:hypothetical protein